MVEFKYLIRIIGYCLALFGISMLFFNGENPVYYLILVLVGVVLTRIKKLKSKKVKAILDITPSLLIISLAVAFTYYRLYGAEQVMETLLSWGFGVFIVSLFLVPIYKRLFKV